MPDPAPAKTATQSNSTAQPSIGGVTTKAREARAAEERPASEATLSIMPTASDLAGVLGIRGKASPAKTRTAASATEEEDPSEETEEEEETPAPEETEETPPGEETEEEQPSEEETPEAETEETEEEEEPTEELTPEAEKVRTGMQKRIDRLTARNTEAQDRIADLEHELEEAKKGGTNAGPRGNAQSPLGNVTSRTQLDQIVRQAEQVEDWALRNRNGGEIKDKDGNVVRTYDADEVAGMLANARAELRAVPERQQWLASQEQAETWAKDNAPAFFTKGTPHQQALEREWRKVPEAFKTAWPDAKVRLMQMLIGAAFMHEQIKAKGGSAAASTPAGAKKPQVSAKKVPASPSGRPATKAPAKQIAKQQAAKAMNRPGGASPRDLVRALESRLG